MTPCDTEFGLRALPRAETSGERAMTLRILNQRGQALAYTAIALVALLGLTFLAINVAYL